MPTITPADALLTAAHDMAEALKGNIAQTMQTKGAIEELMKIFKRNAESMKEIEEAARPQRVRMKEAHDQRVENKKAHTESVSQEKDTQQPPERTPANVLPQDCPAANTRARTAERMLEDEAEINLEATMMMIKLPAQQPK